MQLAICDDERTVRLNIYELIKEVIEEKNIVCGIYMFDNPQSMLSSKMQFDMVFLDVEMGEISGIQAAELLRDINEECLIFFLTNHESYIDEALNHRAFRYWSKPLNKTRLSYGIDSALKELNDRRKSITVNINGRPAQILTKNIIFIDFQNRKTRIVTTNGELFANVAFGKVDEVLREHKCFCKTYKSCIVNMKYVSSYSHDLIKCVYVDKQYDVYLSRRSYNKFHEKFINWIGGKI